MKKIFSTIVALCAIMVLNAANQVKVEVDAECGQNVQIVATPQTGWHFVEWKEDGNTESTRIIANVQADATFTAVWAPNDYTITVNIEDQDGSQLGGTITGDGSKAFGSDCNLVATVDDCYEFVGWYDASGTLVSTDLAMPTFVVAGDATYTAKFKKIHYTITVISEDDTQGTVAGEVKKD